MTKLTRRAAASPGLPAALRSAGRKVSRTSASVMRSARTAMLIAAMTWPERSSTGTAIERTSSSSSPSLLA
ncbi:hypothetical protein QFZ83_002319 [Variovorax sp. W1I1]|nr:hypothetical protein [Variovorax sp. W1I1]MDQ0608148.1 hypothetical protein [Variovorax sp. W1I1]